MASQAFGRASENLRLGPGESLGIEDVQILEVLVSGVAAKEVQLFSEDSHGVSISSHGEVAVDLGRDPGHGVQVQNVDVVEALFT
eukprot:CAMPEP_0168619240 /NCGR_PEP_ID=MMETSP0449_2-20121227/6495_1 /TAXON_ID=1082188 /ORGANISM="Strombidium rassoulzadegani, Strain ras09" /LENGTH=84 /DNA_ID=CAMNT_0008660159 /DNA_START=801 /DNA_END=1055 /DNA_ORIENTATION=+